jgi:hypothetical protein
MKIGYISSDRPNDYYNEVAVVLGNLGDVTHMKNAKEKWLGEYDLVFVEFIGENAIIASHDTAPKKLVIRTHGVEVYEANLNAVRWENVDIFGALTHHQAQYFQAQLTQTKPKRYAILPLPAMSNLFKLRTDKPTKDIALCGHITGRKGHDQIPAFLSRYPEYHIHVLGKTALYGGPVWEFAQWNVARLGMSDHLRHIGQIGHDEVPEWFRTKTFVWMPSIEEAQSRVLMEGMLCGLTPIIRRWAGADELWPEENIYDDIDDIQRILDMPYEPEKYRQYILDRFSYEKVSEIYKEVLLGS